MLLKRQYLVAAEAGFFSGENPEFKVLI